MKNNSYFQVPLDSVMEIVVHVLKVQCSIKMSSVVSNDAGKICPTNLFSYKPIKTVYSRDKTLIYKRVFEPSYISSEPELLHIDYSYQGCNLQGFDVTYRYLDGSECEDTIRYSVLLIYSGGKLSAISIADMSSCQGRYPVIISIKWNKGSIQNISLNCEDKDGELCYNEDEVIAFSNGKGVFMIDEDVNYYCRPIKREYTLSRL